MVFSSVYSSGHPAVVAVVRDPRAVGKDYVEAIEKSVKVARHGIAFAAEVFNLCEYVSQEPGTDVRLFIDEMRNRVRVAHADAKDTYKKFSAVQWSLFQVCIQNRISAGLADQGDQQIIKRISPQATHGDSSVRSADHKRHKC
jgi:hypothetical protein